MRLPRLSRECGWGWHWLTLREIRKDWRSVRRHRGDYGRPYEENALWIDAVGLIILWPVKWR